MTKSIKIKAFIIFICWLIILAHSIIPHNHVEHDYTAFHGHLHSTADNHKECRLTDEFHTKVEDSGTCSISTLLYHQFCQDNFIIHSGRVDFSSFAAQKGSSIFNVDQNYCKTNFFGSASLRSPPLG